MIVEFLLCVCVVGVLLLKRLPCVAWFYSMTSGSHKRDFQPGHVDAGNLCLRGGVPLLSVRLFLVTRCTPADLPACLPAAWEHLFVCSVAFCLVIFDVAVPVEKKNTETAR